MQEPQRPAALNYLTPSSLRRPRPWWVVLSLWGVPGRTGVWVFVWLSIAIAIGCIGYGFYHTDWLWGGLIALAAIPYWASIRWVDRYDTWSKDPER